MCLLTFVPAGVRPDLGALHNGSVINDDGHGFAIVTDSGLLVRHGMDAAALIEQFAAARAALPDGDAMFHSRLGTSGLPGLDNCHPFRVGGDRRTVLAHNGILPVRVAKTETRSDTRIAAEQLIPAMGSLRSRRTRLRVERWMGPHNRIVVLSVDRRYRQRSYLLNEESGIWDGGIWYSNNGYRPWPDLALERGWCTCLTCDGPLAEADQNCSWCGSCTDCGLPAGYCLCRYPMNRS